MAAASMRLKPRSQEWLRYRSKSRAMIMRWTSLVPS